MCKGGVGLPNLKQKTLRIKRCELIPIASHGEWFCGWMGESLGPPQDRKTQQPSKEPQKTAKILKKIRLWVFLVYFSLFWPWVFFFLFCRGPSVSQRKPCSRRGRKFLANGRSSGGGQFDFMFTVLPTLFSCSKMSLFHLKTCTLHMKGAQ